MDLTTGLTAASQTLSILKQIKELDVSIDEAVFKQKLLELQEAAFESRSALLDVKEELLARDEEIAALKQEIKIAKDGEPCPKCRDGELVFTDKKPVTRARLDQFGVEKWKYSCSEAVCDFETFKIHDPTGMVSKQVQSSL